MVLTRVDHTSSWCHESSAELGIWLYPLYKQVDIAATHFFGQDGGPISEFYVIAQAKDIEESQKCRHKYCKKYSINTLQSG